MDLLKLWLKIIFLHSFCNLIILREKNNIIILGGIQLFQFQDIF